MMQFLIPILVFLAVLSIGGAVVGILSSRRSSLQPRLRAMSGTMESTQEMSGMVDVVRRIGGAASPRHSATLKEQLAMAGYHAQAAAAVYIGSKLLLLFLGIAITALLVVATEMTLATKMYLGFATAGALFFIPNIVVYRSRKKRSAEVRRHLPDVVDLLEICVSAGMGLDMAWNSVADEIRSVSPVLADEMALAMLESQLGASRAAAMRHMAERTGAEELNSLVALLVQTERFGTSVADALRTFAGSMRENRSQRAEEAAEKAAVKLLFPLVLFIFPVMLIVTVGPAGIILYQVIVGTN